MSRDIPIIFSAPMVRALLDGHKTMTRRLLYTERKLRKPGIIPAAATMMSVIRNGAQVALWPPVGSTPEHYFTLSGWEKVEPGDRLYVRENFSGEHCWQDIPPGGWGWDSSPMQRPTNFWYWADGNPTNGDWTKPLPSIHMPRWATRLTLIVTAVKIEPLGQITSADARAEGVQHTPLQPPGENHEYFIPLGNGELMTGWTARDTFANLWSYLHGGASWGTSPEVVAITFRVVKANIDAPEAQAA